MPHDKIKAAARERMARTGEPYTLPGGWPSRSTRGSRPSRPRARKHRKERGERMTLKPGAHTPEEVLADMKRGPTLEQRVAALEEQLAHPLMLATSPDSQFTDERAAQFREEFGRFAARPDVRRLSSTPTWLEDVHATERWDRNAHSVRMTHLPSGISATAPTRERATRILAGDVAAWLGVETSDEYVAMGLPPLNIFEADPGAPEAAR
jgi:hypothetical protein